MGMYSNMASWGLPLVYNLGRSRTPEAEMGSRAVISRSSSFPTTGTCLLPSPAIVHSPTGTNFEDLKNDSAHLMIRSPCSLSCTRYSWLTIPLAAATKIDQFTMPPRNTQGLNVLFALESKALPRRRGRPTNPCGKATTLFGPNSV